MITSRCVSTFMAEVLVEFNNLNLHVWERADWESWHKTEKASPASETKEVLVEAEYVLRTTNKDLAVTGLGALCGHQGHEEVGRGHMAECLLCLIQSIGYIWGQWGTIEEFRADVYQNHNRIENTTQISKQSLYWILYWVKLTKSLVVHDWKMAPIFISFLSVTVIERRGVSFSTPSTWATCVT